MKAWLAPAGDVPWLVETAMAAYGGLVRGMERAGTERWVKACLADPDTVVMRNTTHVGFMQLVRPAWAPGTMVADLIHLYGQANHVTSMGAVDVVAALNAKRKAMGATTLFVGSIYADLSPIAQRLGGRRVGALYALED